VAIILATAFGSFLVFYQPLPAEARFEYHLAQMQTLDKVAEDSGLVPAGSTKADKPLSQFLGRLISPILGITGSLFFILIVVAGIMWLTAAGNEEKVGRAKKILSTAFVGLLLVIMAYTITRFVLSRILSSTKPDVVGSGIGVCFTPATGTGNCETTIDCAEMSQADCLDQGGNWAEGSTCQEACSLQ
jgi:hypothetical protein